MNKLSPSDFKYLWEDCKHCYYRKIKEGVALPTIGFPRIFTKMSGMLQKNVQGHNPNEFFEGLPNGKFVLEEGWLKSKPTPSGKSYIGGRFDLLVEFEDGTHGVIDLKMTDAKDEGLAKFDRQLHAYKYALENPQEEKPISISKMGLLIAAPSDIRPNKGSFYFKAKPVWKEIPMNMPKFLSFVEEVEAVLDGEVPPPNQKCGWCKYRALKLP